MDEYLNNNYGNKLDLQSFISNDHEFLNCKIKNNRALVEARVTTDEMIAHGYSMFVLVIDLATKKVIKKIESPVEPRSFVDVDIKGDSLFFLSNNDPDNIYIVNINTGQQKKMVVKYDFPIHHKAIRSDKITAFDKFLLVDLDEPGYPKVIINLATGQTKINYMFFSSLDDISIPQNESVNLFWGQTFSTDSIRLIAIDRSGKEVWNFRKRVPGLTRFNPVEIIRTDNRFIVKTNDQLYALNVTTGKQNWHKVFSPNIRHAWFWNGKILIYDISNLNQLKVRLIDPATGNYIWSKEYAEVDIYSHLVPMKNELVISTGKKLIVLTDKGEEKFTASNIPINSFIQSKTDQINGKHYLLYFRKRMLYW